MANPISRPVAPLPASITGDPGQLSKEAKAEIKALSGPRPVPYLLTAAFNWLCIVLLIGLAKVVSHPAFTLLVMFLIAGRQMALAYLMHDQSHNLGFRSRYGDLWSNLIISYPLLLITTEKYAQVHMAHHRHYFQDPDPDFHRKSGDEWAQPMALKQLLILLLKDLLALNVIKFIVGKKTASKSYPRRWEIPGWIRPVYYLIFAAIFTWFGLWSEFLLFWVLPLVTFFQVISRIGALSEHRYNLPGATLEESTPLMILTWWQKVLIPDLNFHYHIYHHYFPGVSFSNLPKVHRIFLREGLVDENYVYHGYFDYFRRAVINH